MRAQLLLTLLLGCSHTDRPPTPAPSEPADPDQLEVAPPAAERLPLDPSWQATFTALEEQYRNLHRRTLYVQVDRPLYEPGDTVWVKSWSLGVHAPGEVDGPDGGVTYQLIDPRGSVAASKYVEESGGTGHNDLIVPSGASGGMWTVRTASRWGTAERPIVVAGYEPPRIRKELEFAREAYGPGDEVSAEITLEAPGGGPLAGAKVSSRVTVDGRIVQSPSVTTDAAGVALVRFTLPDAISRPDGLLTLQVDAGGFTEAISRGVPITLNTLSVDFYPEGGDLVTGLPSRVYFRALDAYSQPADLEGRILDDEDVEVARVRSLHDGMGRFAFTPQPDRSYRLVVDAPAGIADAPTLPTPLASGCVLRSYDDLDGELEALRVGVQCLPARQVVLTAAHRDEALPPAAVMAGPDEAAVVYLDGGGGQGITRVTLSDVTLSPIAERLVYRSRDQQLQITVTPKRDSYAPRDEVVLAIETRDADGEPVAAEVALSVVDDAVLKFADDEEGHLLSAVYLESELSEPVEDPGWYFDDEEPDAAAGLDLLMGTKGWRRFARQAYMAAATRPASFDAGEGARAKREEGKVGKKDAPMREAGADKAALNKKALDKQIAANAGVLGQLRGGAELNDVFGSAGLGPGLPSGLDGLIGAKGTQIGAGGLGARGAGLGGGGTAEGLGGGLGTRGRGSGASGYGSGGGSFGAKGPGASARAGGDPIVLGALDSSLINNVIKRNMNQIRYCYQRELQKDPRLAGKNVVKFVIDKDGSVSSASTKSSTLGNPALDACLNGRFLRMQFPAPKGGGIVIVSYPFLFSPDGQLAPTGKVSHSAAAPSYDVVREFPLPRYTGAPPAERTDFRQTVLWAPELHTDSEGRGELRFHLSDAITTFKVTAEGLGGGMVGRGEAELVSTSPFELRTRLPDAVSEGDRLLLPVTVANNRAVGAAVTVETAEDALLTRSTTGIQPPAVWQLGANEASTVYVPLDVTGRSGTATVSVRGASERFAERVERPLTVSPRGFPRSWSLSGELAQESSHTLDLGEHQPGTVDATLTLFPSALADMMQGLDGMLRTPNGCFEQTSSANYPNVMILTYLEDKVDAPRSTMTRARSLLATGYKRLMGYESPSGGFDWWGRDPGHEELTAYGLLQFVDMARVFDVDRKLIERASVWLTGRRDGEGGFKRADKALHRFGRTTRAISASYLTWSLIEAGEPHLRAELAAQGRVAGSSQDPYHLALASLSLLGRGDTRLKGMEGARRLATLQGEDGEWRAIGRTITDSGERDAAVESTALALLALIDADVQPESISRGARWLKAQRLGNGTWGATQATVLALKAVVAHEDYVAANRGDGQVTVKVNGQDVGVVSYSGSDLEPIQLTLPAALLQNGANTLTLGHDGALAMPYAVDLSAWVDTPPSSPEVALDLETALSESAVSVGDTVRLTATVTNTHAEGVSSPLLRVGLPAGTRAQTWQLEQLVERGVVAAFETRPREVTLYLAGLEGSERRVIDLDLSADIPGDFTGPASSAYLYYDAGYKDWESGLALSIIP